MAAASQWPEKLRFAPNIPQRVALRTTTGKPAPSSIGAVDQVLYITTEGQAWYADLAIPKLLELHAIQPGEEFEVTMRKPGGAKPAYWTLEPLRADATDRRLEQQLAGSLAIARGGAPTSNVPAAPASQALPDRQQPDGNQSLMRRLLVQAINDIAAAEAHARAIGIEDFAFSGEDVRAIAISCYIESNRQGVRA
ncbi:MAG: hypothetical protein NVS1B14_13100 [Vulcanimicrobiaceae bacterium]